MSESEFIIHQSRFIDLGLQEMAMPDTYKSVDGIDNLRELVLCRDAQGNPTAIYNQETWDFTPYDEVSKPKCLFKNIFPIIDKPDDEPNQDCIIKQELIDELKYLAFLLIYKLNAGHLGQLSVNSFVIYFRQLRLATRFCYQQYQDNPFVEKLSLKEMLGTSQWIAKYLKSDNTPNGSGLVNFKVVLSHLQYLGEKETGIQFSHCSDDIKVDIDDPKQHPVIPTRLYVEIVDTISINIEQLLLYGSSLEKFIRCFNNLAYGKMHSTQTASYGLGKGLWHPTFEEGANQYELDELFDEYGVNSVKTFCKFLSHIQGLVKNAVHLYSGMRDKETRRLPIACIDHEVVTSDIEENGKVVDKGRMIALLSTTTKYTGYRKEARWLAPDDVVSAIKIGQHIARGLASLCNLDENDAPLFLTTACLYRDAWRNKPQVTEFKKYHTSFWFGDIKIDLQDFEELKTSDSERLWDDEKAFSVGEQWPLTSHQFRRSLAFYGASSGHIKLPNMRRQFQHLLRSQVTAYYGRNHEKMMTLFGVYNVATDQFEIPKNHIINDIRTGIPLSTAEALINDLLGGDEVLFGKPTSYINRMREELVDDEVIIIEVREETVRRVKQGEMTYRETLVGGCVGTDPCEEYMLGNLSTGHCLGCSGANVKLSKVEALIIQTQKELTKFSKESGEYQILSTELKTLTTYHNSKVKMMESAHE